MRLIGTPYKSPQLSLFPPGEVEWHLVLLRPPAARRKRAKGLAIQLPLFELEAEKPVAKAAK